VISEANKISCICFSCPRCGEYIFSNDSYIEIFDKTQNLSVKTGLIISNNIFHNYQNPFIITKNFVNYLFSINDKDPLTKIDSFILTLFKHSDFISKNILLTENKLAIEVESWLCGDEELNFAIDLLIDSGYLRFTDGGSAFDSIYTITADGYKHLDKLLKNSSQSQQGFIAMSFKTDLDIFFKDAIIPAIT
jgi:hypothetical protein